MHVVFVSTLITLSAFVQAASVETHTFQANIAKVASVQATSTLANFINISAISSNQNDPNP